MYDAPRVQVVYGGDELADEGSGREFTQSTVGQALDVVQQFAARGELRHQTVQRRRLLA